MYIYVQADGIKVQVERIIPNVKLTREAELRDSGAKHTHVHMKSLSG